jgi:hypothetical protein
MAYSAFDEDALDIHFVIGCLCYNLAFIFIVSLFVVFWHAFLLSLKHISKSTLYSPLVVSIVPVHFACLVLLFALPSQFGAHQQL